MKWLTFLATLCHVCSCARHTHKKSILNESSSDDIVNVSSFDSQLTFHDLFGGSSLMDASEPRRVIDGVSKSKMLGEYADLGWMRVILNRLWPKAVRAIWNFVETMVNPELASKLPFPLNSLQIRKFTLDNFPEVGPVKIYESDDGDGFKAHLRIRVQTTSSISLSGAVGIKSLSVEGDLVAHIAPIIDQLPVVGGLTLYFLDAPDLDIQFQGLASVADIPGAAGLIRTIINKVVKSIVVLPSVIGVPIAQEAQGVSKGLFKSPRPIGIARVTIHEVELEQANRSSPYVVVELAGESWSAEPPKELSFEAGTTHNFLIYDQMQRIRFTVWGMYWFSSSFFGAAAVPLSQAFAHKGHSGEFWLWDKDDMERTGTLKADVRQLVMIPYSDDYNGIVLAVTVQSLTLPSGSVPAAKVTLKLGEHTKTTHMGEISAAESGLAEQTRNIIARCYEEGMPADRIARIVGCKVEKVHSVIKVIRARKSFSVGRIFLDLSRKFHFPFDDLESVLKLPINLQIFGKDKKTLGVLAMDLRDIGLENGVGAGGCCTVEKHMVVNDIEINFEVSLFSLEDKMYELPGW